MTTLHAQLIGDKAVLPRAEFERLVELARRSEEVELQTDEEDVPTVGILRLAEEGGAFDWLAEEEDLYTANDLKVRYR
ncbi:MAG: hypothetical protein HY268_24065 [Deltaproteobacteria bacterium]|nr:hypothetical protein [Deltaproteobacteria bacterium]